jgi:hypothetical protein
MKSERGTLKTEKGHVTSTNKAERSPTIPGDTTVGIVYIQWRAFSNFISDLIQLFDTKGWVNEVTAVTRSEARLLNNIFCHLSVDEISLLVQHPLSDKSCLFNGKWSSSRYSLSRGRLRGHWRKVKIDKAVRADRILGQATIASSLNRSYTLFYINQSSYHFLPFITSLHLSNRYTEHK